MSSNGNQNDNSALPSNVDSDKYLELQKQYNELQNKFEKKKVIYNKINKGLKVISSYLNKKKKVEQERKNKKKLNKSVKEKPKATFQQPSNDYTEYNFSEADYETTTNNDTPNANLNEKIISNQKDNNLFNSSNIKVKFDQMSNNKNLNKIHNQRVNSNHKKHVKISSMNELNNSQDINADVFMTNENELIKLLDNEDMLNLKELDELNRLISDGYTLDDNVPNNESPAIGKYCESCNDYVISENDTSSSTDEDWDSSDSDDSLDISVSGMSGWSGLSGLSNNNKVEYYSDGYQSDDEGGSEQENDNLVQMESTTSNNMNFKNDKSNENLILLKGRKSIQFDRKEELNNQMKIHQHKVEKGKRKSKNLHKSKSIDEDDIIMSDSSLPISRITTQNTTNSMLASDNDMNKDESISKVSADGSSTSVKPHKKEHGKRVRKSGKDDQYDAIKELHRKAIRMYKKKLIKKRQRMMEKKNAEKGNLQDQKKNTKLRPIKEVLGTAVVLDNIAKKPNNVIVPNINFLPIAHEQQQQQIQQQALMQNGMMQYNNMFMSNLPTMTNPVMQTPYKENQMFFNGLAPMNQNKDAMYYNTPNTYMMMNNTNTNQSIETSQMNTASPINDPNSLLNYKPQMNTMAASPKFSNVRLSSGMMPMGTNIMSIKRPSIPSSNPSFNNFSNSNVDTPSLDTTITNTIVSPSGSNNGGNMNKVIQQFANVYIQPTQKPEEEKVKTKKKYVKNVVNIPEEFKDKDVITEEDLFNIFGLRISEKTKTAVDIWNQFHQINEMGHSFDKLNKDFGTKWKMKCEAKFIKKYNRRHVMIKAVKGYMKLNNTDDPYECLNKLDKYLSDENKPISYFFIRQHLPDWLQV